MAKSLLEILHKYHPGESNRAWLSQASDIRVFADKEKAALKICAFFPELVRKNKIYAVEQEIREAYSLSHPNILIRIF